MATSDAGVRAPPRSTILVRRVTEPEWASVRRLRLRALATDPLSFVSTSLRESEWGDSRWLDWVHTGSSASSEALWVAVQDDGSLVGMAGVYSENDRLRVRGTWVEPALRGQGIGGELLDGLLAWVKEAHPSQDVCLSVNPGQEPAVRLFRSRGFEATGLVQPLGHTPGTTVQEMVRKPAEGTSPARS